MKEFRLQERHLAIAALVISVLGLAAMFIYAEEFSLAAVAELDSLDGGSPEQAVRLQGRIARLHDSGKVAFLELEAQRLEQVTVVVFKEEDIFLREGQFVEVSGTVEEYEGKKEVIASSITLR